MIEQSRANQEVEEVKQQMETLTLSEEQRPFKTEEVIALLREQVNQLIVKVKKLEEQEE